jgi:hypothetical protein
MNDWYFEICIAPDNDNTVGVFFVQKAFWHEHGHINHEPVFNDIEALLPDKLKDNLDEIEESIFVSQLSEDETRQALLDAGFEEQHGLLEG